jgi:ribosomal protein S8
MFTYQKSDFISYPPLSGWVQELVSIKKKQRDVKQTIQRVCEQIQNLAKQQEGFNPLTDKVIELTQNKTVLQQEMQEIRIKLKKMKNKLAHIKDRYKVSDPERRAGLKKAEELLESDYTAIAHLRDASGDNEEFLEVTEAMVAGNDEGFLEVTEAMVAGNDEGFLEVTEAMVAGNDEGFLEVTEAMVAGMPDLTLEDFEHLQKVPSSITTKEEEQKTKIVVATSQNPPSAERFATLLFDIVLNINNKNSGVENWKGAVDDLKAQFLNILIKKKATVALQVAKCPTFIITIEKAAEKVILLKSPLNQKYPFLHNQIVIIPSMISGTIDPKNDAIVFNESCIQLKGIRNDETIEIASLTIDSSKDMQVEFRKKTGGVFLVRETIKNEDVALILQAIFTEK